MYTVQEVYTKRMKLKKKKAWLIFMQAVTSKICISIGVSKFIQLSDFFVKTKKVLLKHRQAHSFMYYQCLFLQYKSRAECG